MNVLLKSALVIDSQSEYHQKRCDILIEKGIIIKIAPQIRADKAFEVIESENLCVSPGWIDMQANFCDPGFEHREELISGIKAATQGGYSGVVLVPSTNPPLHTKSQIEYILNKINLPAVELYPMGCISADREGKDLAEMFDMKNAGAVAFSDGKKALKDAGLLMRALQYSANIDSLIVTHCDDSSITGGGQMNDGNTSTKLGLKGIPAIAEEVMIERNISILEFTGGRLHFPTISTARSVELIKAAKAKGLNVTAGVAAYNLLLDDENLNDFNTNYKVNPPLRTKTDAEILRKAVANGIIDVVVSDHTPLEIEAKDVEFDHALFGMIGLETSFACANTAMQKYPLEKLIDKLSVNPRKILGLESVSIEENAKANLTIFDPNKKWKVEKKHIRSKSLNCPFLGMELNGKVIAVIHKNQLHIAE